MKKLIIVLFVLFQGISLCAQENIEDLLSSGINDAQRFVQSYTDPAGESLIHNLNNGWFNSGRAKSFLAFEIGIVANASFVNNENQSFILDINDFENLRFADPSVTSQSVSTFFGDIENVNVIVEGPLPGAIDDAAFELPTGIGSANVNIVPSAFLQASLGLFKGTEIKARFFPTVEIDDVEAGLFGFGIQHEFTKWLPARSLFPVAISGLIAYTNLNASYDFTESGFVNGNDQRLETNTDTWLFQLIGSTKLPIFNVYGGVGFVTGTSNIDLRGTYNIQSGVTAGQTLVDPFSVESNASGVRGTLGIRLKFGFFRFNAAYTLADFNNLSVGLHVGFR